MSKIAELKKRLMSNPAFREEYEKADAEFSAIMDIRRKLATGEEEMLPAALVDRMIAGESPLRIWREHRGLTSSSLAEKSGVVQSYISEIETGKKDGSLKTMKKLADALDVSIDDLA